MAEDYINSLQSANSLANGSTSNNIASYGSTETPVQAQHKQQGLELLQRFDPDALAAYINTGVGELNPETRMLGEASRQDLELNFGSEIANTIDQSRQEALARYTANEYMHRTNGEVAQDALVATGNTIAGIATGVGTIGAAISDIEQDKIDILQNVLFGSNKEVFDFTNAKAATKFADGVSKAISGLGSDVNTGEDINSNLRSNLRSYDNNVKYQQDLADGKSGLEAGFGMFGRGLMNGVSEALFNSTQVYKAVPEIISSFAGGAGLAKSISKVTAKGIASGIALAGSKKTLGSAIQESKGLTSNLVNQVAKLKAAKAPQAEIDAKLAEAAKSLNTTKQLESVLDAQTAAVLKQGPNRASAILSNALMVGGESANNTVDDTKRIEAMTPEEFLSNPQGAEYFKKFKDQGYNDEEALRRAKSHFTGLITGVGILSGFATGAVTGGAAPKLVTSPFKLGSSEGLIRRTLSEAMQEGNESLVPGLATNAARQEFDEDMPLVSGVGEDVGSSSVLGGLGGTMAATPHTIARGVSRVISGKPEVKTTNKATTSTVDSDKFKVQGAFSSTLNDINLDKAKSDSEKETATATILQSANLDDVNTEFTQTLEENTKALNEKSIKTTQDIAQLETTYNTVLNDPKVSDEKKAELKAELEEAKQKTQDNLNLEQDKNGWFAKQLITEEDKANLNALGITENETTLLRHSGDVKTALARKIVANNSEGNTEENDKLFQAYDDISKRLGESVSEDNTATGSANAVVYKGAYIANDLFNEVENIRSNKADERINASLGSVEATLNNLNNAQAANPKAHIDLDSEEESDTSSSIRNLINNFNDYRAPVSTEDTDADSVNNRLADLNKKKAVLDNLSTAFKAQRIRTSDKKLLKELSFAKQALKIAIETQEAVGKVTLLNTEGTSNTAYEKLGFKIDSADISEDDRSAIKNHIKDTVQLRTSALQHLNRMHAAYRAGDMDTYAASSALYRHFIQTQIGKILNLQKSKNIADRSQKTTANNEKLDNTQYGQTWLREQPEISRAYADLLGAELAFMIRTQNEMESMVKGESGSYSGLFKARAVLKQKKNEDGTKSNIMGISSNNKLIQTVFGKKSSVFSPEISRLLGEAQRSVSTSRQRQTNANNLAQMTELETTTTPSSNFNLDFDDDSQISSVELLIDRKPKKDVREQLSDSAKNDKDALGDITENITDFNVDDTSSSSQELNLDISLDDSNSLDEFTKSIATDDEVITIQDNSLTEDTNVNIDDNLEYYIPEYTGANKLPMLRGTYQPKERLMGSETKSLETINSLAKGTNSDKSLEILQGTGEYASELTDKNSKLGSEKNVVNPSDVNAKNNHINTTFWGRFKFKKNGNKDNLNNFKKDNLQSLANSSEVNTEILGANAGYVTGIKYTLIAQFNNLVDQLKTDVTKELGNSDISPISDPATYADAVQAVFDRTGNKYALLRATGSYSNNENVFEVNEDILNLVIVATLKNIYKGTNTAPQGMSSVFSGKEWENVSNEARLEVYADYNQTVDAQQFIQDILRDVKQSLGITASNGATEKETDGVLGTAILNTMLAARAKKFIKINKAPMAETLAWGYYGSPKKITRISFAGNSVMTETSKSMLKYDTLDDALGYTTSSGIFLGETGLAKINEDNHRETMLHQPGTKISKSGQEVLKNKEEDGYWFNPEDYNLIHNMSENDLCELFTGYNRDTIRYATMSDEDIKEEFETNKGAKFDEHNDPEYKAALQAKNLININTALEIDGKQLSVLKGKVWDEQLLDAMTEAYNQDMGKSLTPSEFLNLSEDIHKSYAQHYKYQFTISNRLQHIDAYGSPVSDKISRETQIHKNSISTVDPNNAKQRLTWGIALAQATGAAVWRIKPSRNADNFKKQYDTFAKDAPKDIISKIKAGIIDKSVVDYIKSESKTLGWDVSPLLLRALVEYTKYKDSNNPFKSSLYIEIDARSSGPSQMIQRYTFGRFTLNEWDQMSATGFLLNYMGPTWEMIENSSKDTLDKEIADLEAKPSANTATKLILLKDLRDSLYGSNTDSSVNSARKGLDGYSRGAGFGSSFINNEIKKALTKAERDKDGNITEHGSDEVIDAIKTCFKTLLGEDLTEAISRSLAKKLAVPDSYGAGLGAMTSNLTKALDDGIATMYSNYLRTHGNNDVPVSRESLIKDLAEANDLSVEEVENTFKALDLLSRLTVKVNTKGNRWNISMVRATKGTSPFSFLIKDEHFRGEDVKDTFRNFTLTGRTLDTITNSINVVITQPIAQGIKQAAGENVQITRENLNGVANGTSLILNLLHSIATGAIKETTGKRDGKNTDRTLSKAQKDAIKSSFLGKALHNIALKFGLDGTSSYGFDRTNKGSSSTVIAEVGSGENSLKMTSSIREVSPEGVAQQACVVQGSGDGQIVNQAALEADTHVSVFDGLNGSLEKIGALAKTVVGALTKNGDQNVYGQFLSLVQDLGDTLFDEHMAKFWETVETSPELSGVIITALYQLCPKEVLGNITLTSVSGRPIGFKTLVNSLQTGVKKPTITADMARHILTSIQDNFKHNAIDQLARVSVYRGAPQFKSGTFSLNTNDLTWDTTDGSWKRIPWSNNNMDTLGQTDNSATVYPGNFTHSLIIDGKEVVVTQDDWNNMSAARQVEIANAFYTENRNQIANSSIFSKFNSSKWQVKKPTPTETKTITEVSPSGNVTRVYKLLPGAALRDKLNSFLPKGALRSAVNAMVSHWCGSNLKINTFSALTELARSPEIPSDLSKQLLDAAEPGHSTLGNKVTCQALVFNGVLYCNDTLYNKIISNEKLSEDEQYILSHEIVHVAYQDSLAYALGITKPKTDHDKWLTTLGNQIVKACSSLLTHTGSDIATRLKKHRVINLDKSKEANKHPLAVTKRNANGDEYVEHTVYEETLENIINDIINQGNFTALETFLNEVDEGKYTLNGKKVYIGTILKDILKQAGYSDRQVDHITNFIGELRAYNGNKLNFLNSGNSLKDTIKDPRMLARFVGEVQAYAQTSSVIGGIAKQVTADVTPGVKNSQAFANQYRSISKHLKKVTLKFLQKFFGSDFGGARAFIGNDSLYSYLIGTSALLEAGYYNALQEHSDEKGAFWYDFKGKNYDLSIRPKGSDGKIINAYMQTSLSQPEVATKLHNAVANFLDKFMNKSPSVMEKASATQQQCANALQGAQNHGFSLSYAERQLFREIYNTVALGVKADTVLARDLNTLVHKGIDLLKPDVLDKQYRADNPNISAQNIEKYRFLRGIYNSSGSGADVEAQVVPTFIALAYIDPHMREFARHVKYAADKPFSSDNSVEQAVVRSIDKVAGVISNLHKNRPDNLNEAIEGFLDIAMENARDANIANVAAQGFTTVLDAGDALGTKAQGVVGTALQRTKSPLAKFVGFTLSRNAIEGNSSMYTTGEIIQNYLYGHKGILWNITKGFIREFNNVTPMLHNLYIVLKQAKTAIERESNKYRVELPKAIKEKFKTELSKEQWKHLHHAFSKANLTALVKYSNADIIKFLTDKNTLQNKIDSIERTLTTEQAKFYKQGTTHIANYMVTGRYFAKDEVPTGLVYKNTKALARALGYSTKIPADITSVENTLTELTALKAIKLMDKEVKDSISNIITKDPEGYSYVFNNVRQHRLDDMHKLEETGNEFNYYESYIPKTNVNTTNIIVMSDKTALTDLNVKLGYKRLGDYRSNYVDQSMSECGYYTINYNPEATFIDGAFSITNFTAGGINLETGSSVEGTVSALVTDTKLIRRYARNIDGNQGKKNTEYFIPKFNAKGQIVALERSVDPAMYTAQAKNEDLADMLGEWSARQLAEQNKQKFMQSIAQELVDLYNKDILNRSSNLYVNIFDDKSLNNHQRDAIQRMTPASKKALKDAFGGNPVMIREDLINQIIGMHKASVADLYTGRTELPTGVRKALFKGLEALTFSPNSLEKLIKLEHNTQKVISHLKTSIVVRSIQTVKQNGVANIIELNMLGVSWADIAHSIPKKVADCEKYVKWQQETIQIDADLAAYSLDNDKKTTLEARKKAINSSIKRLSIYPLIKAGEFNTITDAGLSDQDIQLLEGKLGEGLQNIVDNLPDAVVKGGKQLLLTKDTAMYQFLAKATQYGDFVAKAILYDNEIKKNKGIKSIDNEKRALYQATTFFVNYDFMPSRFRDFAESIGLLWFYNYKLRMSKVATHMIAKNPLRALMWGAGINGVLDAGFDIAFKDSFLGRLLGMGPSLSYTVGPAMAVNGLTSNPIMSLAGLAF